MAAIPSVPGNAGNNPEIVNALSGTELCGALITLPAAPGVYFICPADKSRTHISIQLQGTGNQTYATPLGRDFGGGYRLSTNIPFIDLTVEFAERAVQSEWYVITDVGGETIAVQSSRQNCNTPPLTPCAKSTAEAQPIRLPVRKTYTFPPVTNVWKSPNS